MLQSLNDYIEPRLIRLIGQIKDPELLESLWEKFPQYRKDEEYVHAVKVRRLELKKGVSHES